MRVLIPVLLLGLAACAPQVPSSVEPSGVGFGSPADYAQVQARREAELSGSLLPDTPVISGERTGGVGTDVVEITGLPQTAAGPLRADNPGLSDEQSFEAVSNRETIESDAARLARLRAARQVIAPGALPERPRSSGPNIVAYALQTDNVPGQARYKRSPVNAEARYQRACAQYPSADRAQEAFLEMGGPENDRRGMDPDGDGFACGWDPTPFRAARR